MITKTFLFLATLAFALVTLEGTVQAMTKNASNNLTCGTYTNSTNTPTANNSSVYIPVYVAGCFGSPSATSTVSVNIEHPRRGDLTIDLVAYDGTEYRLKNSNWLDWRADVHATYVLDLSSERINAPWFLKVTDGYTSATGYVNNWTLTL